MLVYFSVQIRFRFASALFNYSNWKNRGVDESCPYRKEASLIRTYLETAQARKALERFMENRNALILANRKLQRKIEQNNQQIETMASGLVKGGLGDWFAMEALQGLAVVARTSVEASSGHQNTIWCHECDLAFDHCDC